MSLKPEPGYYYCHCRSHGGKPSFLFPLPAPDQIFFRRSAGQYADWSEETHSIKECVRYEAVRKILQPTETQ